MKDVKKDRMAAPRPAHEPWRDRPMRERVHDPYKQRSKLTEPSICPQCKAVYHKGRWTWDPWPEGAQETVCQACHRKNDHYPAGFLTISGGFARDHEQEIVHLARNTEKVEKAEHPLHRIMDIEHQDDALLITTTDIHLPRRIGEAIQHAFNGQLDYHYEEGAYLIRLRWSREH
jgi:hypothetical protein